MRHLLKDNIVRLYAITVKDWSKQYLTYAGVEIDPLESWALDHNIGMLGKGPICLRHTMVHLPQPCSKSPLTGGLYCNIGERISFVQHWLWVKKDSDLYMIGSSLPYGYLLKGTTMRPHATAAEIKANNISYIYIGAEIELCEPQALDRNNLLLSCDSKTI